MAYVLTYTNLVTAIENYLERIDSPFVSEIPLFIMLGERRVSRDLKILGLKVFITDTLLVGQETLQKPNRWLNSSSFNIGTGTGFNTRVQVLQRSYEYCRMYWPDPTQTAQPKYYSDYDFNHWLITPTPDLAYPYEIAYYQVPQLIDSTVSTNWLTENAPDILLYATLLETASYLKDDDRVAVWTQYYEVAKKALSEEDMRRIYDGFSKRGG
jgi:hypothetical protein